MFDSEARTATVLLPEHLNYGTQAHRLYEIPDIDGLYYFGAFLDEDSQRELIERTVAEPWRADLGRRVQHYGWRYDYQRKNGHARHGIGAFARLGGGTRPPPVRRDQAVRSGSRPGDRERIPTRSGNRAPRGPTVFRRDRGHRIAG